MKTFSKQPDETMLFNVDCALCGGRDFLLKWKNSDIPFVRCRNCGLVFQNPMPSAEELALRYDGEYYDYEIENEESFYRLMILGLEDLGFFDREACIFSRCKNEGRRPSFVDVGCATGKLLSTMKDRGWDVNGAEVCRPAAQYGIEKRGVDIHIGPLESAGIPDATVDVLHCSHLIEHLTRPDLFVAEVARILRPGGLFIVVTPDISGFQARLFGSEWRSAIADHMYLFSKETLSAMFAANGFKIIKKASWGGLAAGTSPKWLKIIADRVVKPLGAGDVISIMGMISL
ncbi:MAG: class I SAM-dependent methyltransferase [Spirochaetales bacterium]|uniref:Class I SAM-dependent methyltransferase n=1 Tax=Candidatus Thalassospirochaeta sargassi TaxID=3119039 RepID=A0AAJ1ILW9_9SPIO|nr:class I SAM-dependent methyltransferase [Spirochaetales bacterium]